jgi:hypothetical protein
MAIRMHYTIIVYLQSEKKAYLNFAGFFNNAKEALDAMFQDMSPNELAYIGRIEIVTKEVRIKR